MRVLLDTKPFENLILDIITNAPASIRAVGITDMVSIATGSWDGKFAHERGKNPQGMEFIPWVYDNAQNILHGMLDCAEAAGRGEKDGLKTLFDCLAMEVQLCNQVGHAQPEEGSEHYFAYSVENLMVETGIMIISRLQEQASGTLEAALKVRHIPLDKIPPSFVEEALRGLPAYCRKHNLAYGLAHELETR
jgi:glycerol-1-phosphate dehydrogenase [NAD(P)+]